MLVLSNRHTFSDSSIHLVEVKVVGVDLTLDDVHKDRDKVFHKHDHNAPDIWTRDRTDCSDQDT